MFSGVNMARNLLGGFKKKQKTELQATPNYVIIIF